MDIKELCVNHDYYCSDTNYYDDEKTHVYRFFDDFIYEWGNIDIDMNLIFRWDLYKFDDQEKYHLQLSMIQQRKGIYNAIIVEYFKQSDVNDFLKFIKPHQEKIKQLWTPLSF